MNAVQTSVRFARRHSRWAVVIAMLGLGGCFPTPGTNIADEFGEFAGFCGFLQDCGSHNDRDRGGNGNQDEEDTSDDAGGPPVSGAAAPTGGGT